MTFNREIHIEIMLDLIISFDNLSGSNPNLLPLTSIYAADRDVASEGVKTLLRRIDEPQLPVQTMILPVNIFNKEATTGPVKA